MPRGASKRNGGDDPEDTSAPTGERRALNRRVLELGSRPRSLKTSEIVARDLAKHIVSSQLPEGEMLPTERTMAESLGVGRTTMREALRLLETRGVITIRPGPGGGPVVRRPRPTDLSEALTLILQFEGSTFEEVMAARVWLEPIVARSAAAHIDDEAIAELEAVNAEHSEQGDDPPAMAATNRRFHSIIAENCGNVLLRIFAETLVQIADGRSVGVTYGPRQVASSTASHARMIEAFKKRDADAAEAAMQEHLEEATVYWHRKFGDLIARPVRWTA
jgi:DNA-binding FadR family transcriptional regulator